MISAKHLEAMTEAAAVNESPEDFREAFNEAVAEAIMDKIEDLKESIMDSFKYSDGSTLVEEIVGVQVIDPKKTAKELTAIGLNAKVDTKLNDEVTVDLKDKSEARKLKNWMLKNGWDKYDIQDAYPEIERAAK